MPAPILSFAGLNFSDSVTGGFAGAGWPPDTNGDVGRNHYIEAVNDAFAIYDKTGTLLAAFTEDSLWSQSGTNACNGNSMGDPVVVYDQLADRWILTNFAFAVDDQNSPISPFLECIAASMTNDPVAGGWWLYAIQMDTGADGEPPLGTLNDYPKFGIWPDGCLYMSANGFAEPGDAYAGAMFASFPLSALESGATLNFGLGFLSTASDPFTMIPSNLLGVAPGSMPAPGTPNYFVSESQIVFAYEVRKFSPGPSCGGGGNLGEPVNVSQAVYAVPFGDIVPQPNTGTLLDSLEDRLMQKVQYRRVGSAESLWVVHNVQTSPTSPVVPQWAQLDVTGGTVATTPVQEQIYTPDTVLNRWMASIAADQAGNMALGYSTSNGSIPNFPSIAYSGRLVSDPPGSLSQTETQLIAGSGSQDNACGPFTNCPRWGDYTAMSVDPVDDCTFWYINEYYSSQANGDAGDWQTRIGSFKFPTCAVSFSISGQVTLSGSGLAGVTVTLSGSQSGSTTTDGAGNYSFTMLPGGAYTVTPSLAGYTFDPPNLTFDNLSGNQSGADFAASIASFTISGTVFDGFGIAPPLPGVTMALSGSQSGSTVTDSFGDYSFIVAGGGNYTVTPSLGGPTFTPPNQSYSSLGSNQIANFVLGAGYIISGQVSLAGSGLSGVTMTLSGSQSATTVTDSLGNYSFAEPAGANLTVTPSLTGYTFSPLSLSFNNLSANQTANFTASLLQALQFVPVTPCRVVDTRNAIGPLGGPGLFGNSRDFPIPTSPCGIPGSAIAYAFNVTAVPSGPLGYLTIWPTGQAQPVVSTLNSKNGIIKADAAIVLAGTNGSVSVYGSAATNVVLDINGYFVSGDSSALAFYPVTPCRLADTRNAAGPLGGPIMGAGQTRTFPLPTSSCNSIPAGAQAYSLNFTVVPGGVQLGYLTTWPTGQSQPVVSTLNAPTGLTTANAAIVQAGTSGSIDVFTSNTTHVVIDINGYFAPVASGGLSFYGVTPCRAVDTRNANGPLGGPELFGQRDFPLSTSNCGLPGSAQAYSLNATVVPQATLGYLTLWPAGQSQPVVSTLNSPDGSTDSNAAIVPTINGSISAYASSGTALILDANGYFAP